jgi:propanediol utilization protein
MDSCLRRNDGNSAGMPPPSVILAHAGIHRPKSVILANAGIHAPNSVILAKAGIQGPKSVILAHAGIQRRSLCYSPLPSRIHAGMSLTSCSTRQTSM